MGFRDVMNALTTIEAGLSISAPVSISNPRAYKVAPSRNVALTNKVTFMNWLDAGSEKRMGTQREDAITVQVDCFVKEANLERGADIALAFFDAAWDAFDAQRPAGTRLAGTVSYLTLRAVRPALETLEWAGHPYPGFHIFLDLVVFEDVS